jgi:hypothetical protein
MTDILTSRRQLIGAGGAGLATALVTGAPAQAAGDCGFSRALYDDYLHRFNNNDMTFIDFYADDVELELGNATIKGPIGIRDFYAEVKAHIKETVEIGHYVADTTGIAAEMTTEFGVIKDWSGGYFQRDLKKGEVMRITGIGLYWVRDGKFTKIKFARLAQLNDWRQEGFKA